MLSVSSVSLAIDDLAIILFLFLSLELHIECLIVRPRKFSGLLLNLRCWWCCCGRSYFGDQEERVLWGALFFHLRHLSFFLFFLHGTVAPFWFWNLVRFEMPLAAVLLHHFHQLWRVRIIDRGFARVAGLSSLQSHPRFVNSCSVVIYTVLHNQICFWLPESSDQLWSRTYGRRCVLLALQLKIISLTV